MAEHAVAAELFQARDVAILTDRGQQLNGSLNTGLARGRRIFRLYALDLQTLRYSLRDPQ